jgi:hypothetical protein
MDAMKYDMSGGATVIGTMRAIAVLKPSVPVIGVVAAVENMPDGNASRPSDVVTAMTGKTVEILNTDAEGRLVLADAVAYAERQGATRIVDMATLTGAVIIALGDLNTGRSLDGESGGAYLFNPAGQVVNSVEYGFQVADRSIGLSSGSWRLLATPTPGAVNAAVATLGASTVLRLNEWMANPANGGDWFELFNTTNQPVDMNALILTDDLSIVGQTRFRIAPLSFIGPNSFVKWEADNDPEQGRNHVNFSLDAQGESLRLYATNGTTLIDSITFGIQTLAVSEGRLPDGQSNVVAFAGSPTPGESNYLPAPEVVINEVLTHSDAPLEDAVELRNTGANAVNIGGWFLSDAQDNFKKYRVPDNTVIPAGGFVVLYQGQFGSSSPIAFTLDSARGDEVWLSAADVVGSVWKRADREHR